jgi:hypothetical protein
MKTLLILLLLTTPCYALDKDDCIYEYQGSHLSLNGDTPYSMLTCNIDGEIVHYRIKKKKLERREEVEK